jgi:hypothetical protein
MEILLKRDPEMCEAVFRKIARQLNNSRVIRAVKTGGGGSRKAPPVSSQKPGE